MNYFIIILTFCLSIVDSYNDTVKKELTGYSFTIWETEVNGNKIKKSEYKKFDEKGNLLKRIQYLDSFAIIDSFSYEYKNNLIINKKEFSNGKWFYQTIYKYNENNKLVLETEYNRKNKFQSCSKHFYISENVEAIEYYDISNELYCIDTLKYDNKGNLIEETQYIPDGFWFQHHTYDYDNNNNLIIQKTEANPEYDGIGIVESKFEYNSENKIVKETVKIPDAGFKYYIYEYDM
jgi:hypothetical protein